jgi:hypothetical protein
MSLPSDIDRIVRHRAPGDVEPLLSAFISDTLVLPRVRYDLYFARGAEPTGIRFYVGDAKLMNVFPGNSVQLKHVAGGVPDRVPPKASVGPEYIKVKVRDLPRSLHDLEQIRDEAYQRIANG